MSRKGSRRDNAVAGSFVARLEWELSDGCNWRTHAEAHQAIFDHTRNCANYAGNGCTAPNSWARPLSSP